MQDPRNKARLYKRAIKKWGLSLQIEKAKEELAELYQALMASPPQKIFEEMADVEIMLEQLKVLFGCRDMVKFWKIQKLKRLEKRLDETD